MRPSQLFILIFMIVLVLCCISVAIFWDGYYLPMKTCRPITYPEGQRITRTFSVNTQDSTEMVLEFYTNKLNANSASTVEKGKWRMQLLEEDQYLFSCYANDINRITTESGCVYISSEKERTYIVGKFYRSEGSNVQCPTSNPTPGGG